jgi:hypothetical protein
VRHAVGELDADLAHDLDHLGVDPFGRRRSRRSSCVPAVGGPREQRLRHL